MNANEISAALEHVETTQAIADNYARRIANRHVKNRLRSLQLDGSTLRAFKRELRSFNMITGKWGEL
jgi:hypothetical protein